MPVKVRARVSQTNMKSMLYGINFVVAGVKVLNRYCTL